MNTPLEHPLVSVYLDEVRRLTADQTDERRRELLADLGEHIEAALADRGDADDDTDDAAIRTVLEQLGRPQDIAAALAEEGRPQPEPQSPGRTAVTVALVALALPLFVVPAVGPLLGLAAAVVALRRIWTAPQWTRGEKKHATWLLLAPLVVVPAAAFALSPAGLSPVLVLAVAAAGLALPLLAAALLARFAGRLRAAAARPA
ncbi:HAAS signaling domain-containing protein [Kitasatospora cinereorecta]|uniref:HAAS signaling domain-containing protein n=1 Tax=Kitasatospora cinereorecta TaxID=285560 RepID=UPI0031F8209D